MKANIFLAITLASLYLLQYSGASIIITIFLFVYQLDLRIDKKNKEYRYKRFLMLRENFIKSKNDIKELSIVLGNGNRETVQIQAGAIHQGSWPGSKACYNRLSTIEPSLMEYNPNEDYENMNLVSSEFALEFQLRNEKQIYLADGTSLMCSTIFRLQPDIMKAI